MRVFQIASKEWFSWNAWGIVRACLSVFACLFLFTHGGICQTSQQAQAHETMRGPQSVADLAERLIPAVVNISTVSVVEPDTSIPVPEVPKGSPFRKFFNDYFDGEGGESEHRSNLQSLGSGFIIDPTGLIVTNFHVISDADQINVKLHDGSHYGAELVGFDSRTDLALLKIDAPLALPTVAFGGSEKLRVGDWVMAIGNPFGLGGSVSVGIVSARNRNINNGPYDSFIQTDAAINRGNSGGPLFDMYGQVAGVNTAIISPNGASVGLGFAIPSDIVGHVIEQLKLSGMVRRGWLGVHVQSISREVAEDLGLDDVKGAVVRRVSETGPAYKAGVKVGDVILKFDGVVINKVRDLTRLVADTEVGKTVTLEVFRQGRLMKIETVVARLEERENDPLAEEANGQPAATLFGMQLSRLTLIDRKLHNLGAELDGVVVQTVEPGSLADRKGIRKGMVIVECDQEIVSSAEDVRNRVMKRIQSPEKDLLLLIANPDGGALKFVTLALGDVGSAMMERLP
ncbi:Do family serine endopeptidase [uncultured Cohaesibacter sp.]|uniref:Do family serine endopeptidase n=1 Tax=uncultured Cohaesibacter sp. TaxID=1002546 RepID=UPI0029315152|nr:Do family serine endopeptidase [uncultured Cohaesibacter sp.]